MANMGKVTPRDKVSPMYGIWLRFQIQKTHIEIISISYLDKFSWFIEEVIFLLNDMTSVFYLI